MAETRAIRTALETIQSLIDSYLEEDDISELCEEELTSITHIVEGLSAGCACDSYHGFDCGCSERHFEKTQALEELSKLQNQIINMDIDNILRILKEGAEKPIEYSDDYAKGRRDGEVQAYSHAWTLVKQFYESRLAASNKH